MSLALGSYTTLMATTPMLPRNNNGNIYHATMVAAARTLRSAEESKPCTSSNVIVLADFFFANASVCQWMNGVPT